MLTLDTNVIVYAFDDGDSIRRAVAEHIMERALFLPVTLSNQVFGETFRALTRRLKHSPSQAAAVVEDLMASYESVAASRRAFASALAEASSGRLSFWNAVILASAAEAGCTHCFSEDMQDGFRLGPIEVVNPFGANGLSERAARLLSPPRP